MFSENDLVFSYTTKNAVRDGVLVPIPGIISGCCGINVPVYFNDSVWGSYVESLEKDKRTARMSDILLVFAEKARGCNVQILRFRVELEVDPSVTIQPNEQPCSDVRFRNVELKSVINAHDVDDPSPAIFIMLPWED